MSINLAQLTRFLFKKYGFDILQSLMIGFIGIMDISKFQT